VWGNDGDNLNYALVNYDVVGDVVVVRDCNG
jgi:hypothetical protein